MVINVMSREAGMKLPGGKNAGVYPETFGFPPGKSADEYYLMLEQLTKTDLLGFGECPGSGRGWCGSGAANPFPVEPESSDPESRSNAEIDRAVRIAAEEIRAEGQKGMGRLPSSLRIYAELVLKPPKVDWKKRLAGVARNAIAFVAGGVTSRFDGISRRQGGLGFGVGKPTLPRLRAPVVNVGIMVDTSGSMGKKETGEALSHSEAICRATGATVDLYVCDAELHATAKVRSAKEILKLLQGGGGTDFNPVFDHLRTQKNPPDVLVVITDGFALVPEVAPPRVRVIWLLVGDHVTTPAPWGEVIRVED
jgi:predicted metal-dependent peptidase